MNPRKSTHTIIKNKDQKDKRGGSKYLKERWVYWPYTYTETPSDKTSEIDGSCEVKKP